jgi:hypothetical protein
MTESQKEELIGAGVAFMRTVADIYGAEKGMELWSTIADTIDADLKGEVFMALLTGKYRQDKIHIKAPFVGQLQDKIKLIKCIREYDRRNLGLKDAKDISDRLETGSHEVLEVNPDIRPTFVVELRKIGMVVL